MLLTYVFKMQKWMNSTIVCQALSTPRVEADSRPNRVKLKQVPSDPWKTRLHSLLKFAVAEIAEISQY